MVSFTPLDGLSWHEILPISRVVFFVFSNACGFIPPLNTSVRRRLGWVFCPGALNSTLGEQFGEKSGGSDWPAPRSTSTANHCRRIFRRLFTKCTN